MAGASVRLTGVTHRYRAAGGRSITALTDVSFSVSGGEVVAVQGASGSGKSTLLHLIGGMERPTSGSIMIDDLDVGDVPQKRLVQYRRSVGFVFQQFHLLPTMNARDNVLAPLLPYRTSFDKSARAGELLGAVGLGDRSDALPSQLSGGEQQRVAIARALMNEPSLLIADEPTGNLDPATGGEVADLLMDLQRRRGSTLLVATHDPALARLCGRVIHLEGGRIESPDVDVVAPRSKTEAGP
ncbi:MAG: ABC transporter ATP-binding protein [Chloroflexota bacterium]